MRIVENYRQCGKNFNQKYLITFQNVLNSSKNKIFGLFHKETEVSKFEKVKKYESFKWRRLQKNVLYQFEGIKLILEKWGRYEKSRNHAEGHGALKLRGTFWWVQGQCPLGF